MKARMICLCISLVLSLQTFCQERQKRDRYKMASSYIGIEAGWLNAFQVNAIGQTPPSFGFARVTLGGLHFWSRADFYISFPLATRPIGERNGFEYTEGIITGGRYIPFGLRRGTPSPYVGINWTTPRLRIGEGSQKRSDRFGIDAGFTTLLGKSTTLEMGVRYVFNQEQTYFTSIDTKKTITPPEWGIHIGLKKYVDFTASYSTEAGKKYVADNYEKLQADKGLSGWTIQFGPSVALGLQPTNFGPEFGHLENKPSTFYPDMGLGYYFDKPDMSINLSFRPMVFKGNSFGDTYKDQQFHLHVEGFKVLFDWNGFAPFLGVFAGLTHHNFDASLGQTDVMIRETNPTGGIIFGWDIRPSKIDWYYLRTNLRYTPLPAFGGEMEPFVTNQLEINFIQFVFFPHRFKTMKS
jgi:hypothetical protein